MPVFQFQCGDCSGISEHLIGLRQMSSLECVNCGSGEVARVQSTYFYPNKNFCPHDKTLDADRLKTQISGIMSDKSQQCGGCGTDGAPGRCSSKGGGCGGGCSCKAGGCASKKPTSNKLKLNIYDQAAF